MKKNITYSLEYFYILILHVLFEGEVFKAVVMLSVFIMVSDLMISP